jgi:hypothetical protein
LSILDDRVSGALKWYNDFRKVFRRLFVTLNLNLPPETEAQIRQLAALSGQNVEAVVLEALSAKLADADLQPSREPQNDQEWKKKLQAWIDLHPVVTHFVDDSRESIYAGRGE